MFSLQLNLEQSFKSLPLLKNCLNINKTIPEAESEQTPASVRWNKH